MDTNQKTNVIILTSLKNIDKKNKDWKKNSKRISNKESKKNI